MCLVRLNLIMQLKHNHHSNNWVLVKSCTTLGTKPIFFWWLICNCAVEMIPVLAFPITPNPWALSIVPPVAYSTETTCKLETLLTQKETGVFYVCTSIGIVIGIQLIGPYLLFFLFHLFILLVGFVHSAFNHLQEWAGCFISFSLCFWWRKLEQTFRLVIVFSFVTSILYLPSWQLFSSSMQNFLHVSKLVRRKSSLLKGSPCMLGDVLGDGLACWWTCGRTGCLKVNFRPGDPFLGDQYFRRGVGGVSWSLPTSGNTCIIVIILTC